VASTRSRKSTARRLPAKRAAAAKVRVKRTAAPKAPARRVAAKKAAPRGRQLPCSDAEGYVVCESPIEPRHFTAAQIRRAVKAAVGG
jgi:hypothetical protein